MHFKYKVLLDGRTYYMPELREGSMVIPVSIGEPNGPDIALRINRREGEWLPLTDEESRILNCKGVDSIEFKKLSVADQLKSQAMAYMISSRVLCHMLIDTPSEISISAGFVVYNCKHLAIELFLKAALSLCSQDFPKIHDIAVLQERYRARFPPQLHFQTQWDVSLDWYEEQFDVKVGNKTDRVPDQVFRYFSGGKENKPPSGWYGFHPGTSMLMCDFYLKKWAELWPRISEYASKSQDTK